MRSLWTALLPVLFFSVEAMQTSFLGAPRLPWAWSRVSTTGLRPSNRQGHAAVEVGSRIYVIGGCVQEIRCFNDVQIFDTELLQWSQMHVTGDAPEPRGGHSATLVGSDIYVFGGASSSDTYEDLYKLDLIKSHWTRAESTGGSAPGRTTNHAAVADNRGRIYIFGGYDAFGNFRNDLWIVDVNSAGNAPVDFGFPVIWQKEVPTGTLPMPRESHSLTLVDQKLFLFGGYGADGAAQNDAHVYNLDTQEWTPLHVNGASPARRQAHAAVRHGRDVVIVGGCDVSDLGPVCYSDVWSFNMISMQWTQRSTDSVTLSPREGLSASFVRGHLFTFGGCQLSSECFDDVAMLDTLDPCPAYCGGHGECVDQQFCRCEPGFTGHDCMQPLSCPSDCGDHGKCSASGFPKCTCDNGWAGPNCAIELPCPGGQSKCSGKGTCKSDGSCQCFAGYSGSDCSSGSPSCVPQDCSGHGYCGLNSQCVCHANWDGPGCSHQVAILEQQCPRGCCGHGSCDAGVCQCKDGWFGPACGVNQTAWSDVNTRRQRQHDALLQDASAKRQQAEKSRLLTEVMKQSVPATQSEATSLAAQVRQLDTDVKELLAAADTAERGAADLLRLDSPQVQAFLEDVPLICAASESLVALGSRALRSQIPVRHKSEKQVLPENKHFGITVNDLGHTGVLDGQCGYDNCNFRGVCMNAECYCQPGFYGETCQFSRREDQSMVRVSTAIVFAIACVILSFTSVLVVLYINKKTHTVSEESMGFDTSLLSPK